MLVLCRRPRERIRVRCPDGTVIWLTVTKIDRGVVRIGIAAPTGYDIKREELLPREERTEK